MTTIDTQALRTKLSQEYKKQGVHYLTDIENTINTSFRIIRQEQDKYHTIDYPHKKAEQYKHKYNIDIQKYAYKHKNNQDIINSVEKYLNAENHKPVGFYAYHSFLKNHVDAFIIHNNKIMILQTSLSSSDIVNVIKRDFPKDKIYIQKTISSYYHPQQDTISCPVFALKYLKECLKDNAEMLSMTQFIPSDNIDTTNNQFIIHPYVERYSQSDTYYTKTKEIWQDNHQSEHSNELLSKADSWRDTHDKSRMMYYLLKDLDENNGYGSLNRVKTNIINQTSDDDTHSDDEDNFF